MGVSTDAILVFGFEIGEEDSNPDFLGDYGDFDEFVADKAGLKGAEYKVRDEFLKTCPADLVLHCSYDYPMHILAVRGTETTARRGYVEEITALTVDPEKIAAFKTWCETNNVPYEEPKWLLCSRMG